MRTASILLLALVVSPGLLPGAPLSADRNEAAEAEIKALEFHLAKLLVERKIDEYETYLGADYTRIGASGVVETREEVLAGFRTSPVEGSASGFSMEPSELDVRIYDETAILTGKLAITNANGIRHSRFRKVFIQRDGRWFLVSLQGTPLQGG